jgi:DNA-binding CsgD family transcriptional regulator
VDLVGRDSELAAITRAVEDGCGVVGVVGEAGIGKTRLLAAFAEQARATGLRVLEGRGAEHERDVPFGLVADALGEPVPAASAERFHQHRALREHLEQLARQRPLALVLDDLHWADEATLGLVLHLLRRPAPFLLAVALRPGDRADRLLAAAPGATWLRLGPLPDPAALMLLQGVDARLRERVLREAAGNPLFLRELARVAGDAELPATVAAVVQRDVARLEPPVRGLLEGAAVAGDPFDPELAAAATGCEPDGGALDALVAAGLVCATGAGRAFAFRHPVVRRAVYDAAPPAWRLEAHERVAAALARRGASASARAYHLAPSARPGDEGAIATLTEAAGDARATAPATAAQWYGTALGLLPAGDDRRAELLAPRALALANAGRLDDSRAALLELLDDDPSRSDLTIACAQVETALGRHGQARRRLLDALEGAAPADQAAIAFELAHDAMTHGRSDELRRWSAHAAFMAEGVEPVVLAGARVLGELGAIWTAGRPPRVEAPLADLDDRALTRRVGVTLQVARAQLRLGRFVDSHATATRALAICRRTPRDELLVWVRVIRSWTLLLLLDLDAALLEAEAAEESARLQDTPHVLMLGLCKRVQVHHHRGEALEAERAAAECEELVRGLEPSAFTAHLLCTTAEMRVAHDPERALRELQAAAGPHLEATDPSMSSAARLVFVRAAIAAGRLEDAERGVADAVGRAAELGLPVPAVRAASARAELLLARGEPARAAALAAGAAASADSVPAPLDALDAQFLAGRALAAAGEAEQAKPVLQQVVGDAGRGGALRLRGLAARELRRLGSRPSAEARRTRPGELTARERDVATLVAAGHSNKQVAAQLYVSEKTVRNTLTRVYAKLEVRSRTQLVAAMSSRAGVV